MNLNRLRDITACRDLSLPVNRHIVRKRNRRALVRARAPRKTPLVVELLQPAENRAPLHARPVIQNRDVADSDPLRHHRPLADPGHIQHPRTLEYARAVLRGRAGLRQRRQ